MKYGNSNVWKHFTEMFDYLAIAALIDDKIFCVHGGLSRNCSTIDQIRTLERFKDIPAVGLLTDLVWSDPDTLRKGFSFSQRGPGCVFGADKVQSFIHGNQLDHIVRSHQLCMDGYQTIFNGSLTTIWSAPNFVNKCSNVACIIEVDEKLQRFHNIYTEAPRYDTKKKEKNKSEYYTEYFL
jgi:serine/threonine-protein phosphatase PPG1